MSGNDHLLNKFEVAEETCEQARSLLYKAKSRTGPGSGRELGHLSTGLPAVCMLIACERLNTTEVTKKSAQAASCLNARDFNKVYTTAQAALEEENVSYDVLHAKYGTENYKGVLGGFMKEVEGELSKAARCEKDSKLFVCVMYFWLCSAGGLKHIPDTEIFAEQYGLPCKKFTNLLSNLNNRCLDIRKRVSEATKLASPSKRATSASPRKAPLRELPSRPSSPTKSPRKAGSTLVEEPITPRRSSRFMEIESPTKATTSRPASPTKASSSRPGSPIKPFPVVSPRKPWQQGPKRELPSRDTPKKTPGPAATPKVATEEADEDAMDVDVPETPSRRTRSPVKSAKALPPHLSPSKPKIPALTFPSTPRTASPTKTPTGKKLAPMELDVESDGTDQGEMEEEDGEEPETRPGRRFRPVYLDHEQWGAVDPRIARMWKRIEAAKEQTGVKAAVKRKRK
ncbi:hypothetical protein BJ165DRAFT_1399971 [Panaeolus papilionaceus]|nr:hypothetical protein BJ165DRAFT_1399971 [Panaeolus papilionaceus]